MGVREPELKQGMGMENLGERSGQEVEKEERELGLGGGREQPLGTESRERRTCGYLLLFKATFLGPAFSEPGGELKGTHLPGHSNTSSSLSRWDSCISLSSQFQALKAELAVVS